MIDCKCRPGDGCWFCSDRCDICMQASKPGFAVQTEDDSLPRLRFCGEECKSFLGPSHDFARFHKPVVSVPEVEVTFTFVSADSEGEHTTIAKATHLLHTNLPICEALTLAVIDVYRVEEGEGLKQGCLFTLFHLKDIYNQVFSEFYLTEECRLDRPFPHVKNLFDDDLITQVNGLLQEGIKQSGHDVQSLISLGSHDRAVATGAAGAAMAVPHFVVLMRGQRSRRFRSRTVPRLDYRIAYTRGRSWLSNPKILATSHLSRFNRCTLPSLLGPSVRVLL